MDLFRSALSLVIHKNGHVSDADIEDLLNFYRHKKGIYIETERYRSTVEAAIKHYQKNINCLFICTDGPCLDKTFLTLSQISLQALRRELNCPVESSGCHWQCERAPSVTLKAGEESRSFPNCTALHWNETCEHVVALVEKSDQVASQDANHSLMQSLEPQEPKECA